MSTPTAFPHERLRWMDDLLAELEKFAARYELSELHGDLEAARKTLLAEAERVNGDPNHPVNTVRSPREH